MLQSLQKFKHGLNNVNHYNTIIHNSVFANISHPNYFGLRNDNLSINCDLSITPQHKIFMDGNIFMDIDFLTTELIDADYVHCNFDMVFFDKMIQSNVYFLHSYCDNVYYHQNNIDKSFFIDTIFNKHITVDTTYSECYFENVTFDSTVFSNPQYIDCVFINCKFVNAILGHKQRLVFNDKCIFFGCEFDNSDTIENELSMKQFIANNDESNNRDSSYAFVETFYDNNNE